MNNLTNREKYLVYGIIAVLPLCVLYFALTYFMGQMKTKRSELRQTQKQLDQMELDMQTALIKVDLHNQHRQRSLAANKSVAQSEYRDWLQRLVEQEIEFSGTPTVVSKATIPFKSEFGKKQLLYQQLNFTLNCQGSYKQLVDLLYRFYEKNYIHRIERIDLNLLRQKGQGGTETYDRNRMSAKIQIQVLSLSDADDARTPEAVENTKLFYDSKESGKYLSELEDYHALILRRNVFGFPNNAPEFGSKSKDFEFEEGDRISVRLTADDEDDDELEFKLVSTDNKVKSDQIEVSGSGRFELDISELGEYEFKAEVTDKNYYPKSDEMKVVVIIEKKAEKKKEDPTPDPPKFDHTLFTVVYAINSNIQGKRFCGIEVRTLGKDYKLEVGDEFKVAEKKGKVIDIDNRRAVIEMDGKRFAYAAGDILGEPKGDEIAKAPGEPNASDSDASSSSTDGDAEAKNSDTEKNATDTKSEDEANSSAGVKTAVSGNSNEEPTEEPESTADSNNSNSQTEIAADTKK